ncbi:MAG: HAMP domain-containing protein, partial [Rhodospirillales bacterium]|nr:HAMP domain-containing protein [Rhodospirillales bacterium]
MHLRLPYQRLLKRVLPRSLLGRSLLMILVPLVLLQAVALQVYYGSHLNLVYRRLSDSLVGEIDFSLALMQRYPGAVNRAWIVPLAERDFGFKMHLEPGAALRHTGLRRNVVGPMDDLLDAALRDNLHRRFDMDWTYEPGSVRIRIQLADGVMDILAPRKRVDLGTIWLFVLWLAGTSALLFAIAALFMRNQVRGIRRLADAVEAFGMGRDPGSIHPEGAVEVRRASTAFNRMAERIRRFLTQRTEMLAGVSHDLRTPLTRMKLALEMLPATAAQSEEIAELGQDIAEMERMIEAYLAFARGEGAEQAETADLAAMLRDLAVGARRAGTRVEVEAPPVLTLRVRADALRRALSNLLENAGRHARHVRLAVSLAGPRGVLVTVDDDGPGIPPERRESVFRPFESGQEGGTGLGLTIARDIVRAHGGEIVLEE